MIAGLIRAWASSVRRNLLVMSKRYSRGPLYRFLDAQVAGIPPGARLLNVGAGGQVGATLAVSLRGHAIGASSWSLDVEAARQPDVQADICHAPFIAGTFDCVVMMEVLEHVREPQQAVDEVFRMLRPGGRFIFSVPFVFPMHARPHDYYRFTKDGLAYLLRRYDAVDIVARSSYMTAAAVVLMRLIMERRLVDQLIGAMAIVVLGPLAALLTPMVGSDAATVGYLGIARKPEPTAMVPP